MKAKHRRLGLLLASMAALAIAGFLVLRALNSNLVFFYSPTAIAENKPAPDKRIRVGGLVEPDSVKKEGGAMVFAITDGANKLTVRFAGTPPDLFREGQGVIAEGNLGNDGIFAAREILAKHDENYMPPEVADALKKAGRWKEGEKPK